MNQVPLLVLLSIAGSSLAVSAEDNTNAPARQSPSTSTLELRYPVGPDRKQRLELRYPLPADGKPQPTSPPPKIPGTPGTPRAPASPDQPQLPQNPPKS